MIEFQKYPIYKVGDYRHMPATFTNKNKRVGSAIIVQSPCGKLAVRVYDYYPGASLEIGALMKRNLGSKTEITFSRAIECRPKKRK